MLNKIKIIGKFSIKEKKEQDERKIDNADFASEEVANDFDKPQSKFDSEYKENRGSFLRFSVFVINPNLSETILRCVVRGEIAEMIKREIKNNDLVEVSGYLRNEYLKKERNSVRDNEKHNSKQILIKVLEFKKLDPDFKVDNKHSNEVRLIGKIITDLQDQQDNRNSEVLSFKLAVPREGNESPLFFCRAHGQELITEIKEKLQKGDIILLEGFLQTKKIEKEVSSEETKKYPSCISSIICRGFTFLDSDSVRVFSPLDNLTHVFKDVKEIDYSKPKFKLHDDEQETN
jgi:hypothetical protein